MSNQAKHLAKSHLNRRVLELNHMLLSAEKVSRPFVSTPVLFRG